MRVEGTRLIAPEENFDAFKLVAVQAARYCYVSAFDAVVFHGLLNPDFINLQLALKRKTYSSAFKRAVMRDLIVKSQAYGLVSSLQGVASLLVTPQPMPAQWFLAGRNTPLDRESIASIADAAAEIFDEIGVRYLRQPRQTMDQATMATLDRYCAGSKRLSGQDHGPHDDKHMNVRYGAIILEQVKNALNRAVQPLARPVLLPAAKQALAACARDNFR